MMALTRTDGSSTRFHASWWASEPVQHFTTISDVSSVLQTSKPPSLTAHSIPEAKSTASGWRKKTVRNAVPDPTTARTISRYPTAGNMTRPFTM